MVTLVSFKLKRDAGQWWKYTHRCIGVTWEPFVSAFQEKFLPSTVREKLRDQFTKLVQLNTPVVEFEATLTSLSRFTPELVATKERRCLEFEKRLRTGQMFKVASSMIRDYRRLMEAAAHLKTVMQIEEERMRGSRKSQDAQGDSKRRRGSNPQQSHGAQSRKANVVADTLSRKSISSVASISIQEWEMLGALGEFDLHLGESVASPALFSVVAQPILINQVLEAQKGDLELVLIGGCDPVTWQVSDSVFIYNFVSGIWRHGTDMPGGGRLFFGSASDFDRMVYVAGGHDKKKNALKSALSYDVAKDEWIKLLDMKKERGECKGVFFDGKFHVISGYPTEMQGRFESDIKVFDITWQWDWIENDFLEDAICPRTCVHSGDSGLYMCHEGNVMTRMDTTWRVLARLSAEVCNVAYMTVWQTKLLVFGSSELGEPYKVYEMDLKNYTWTKIRAPHEYSTHVQFGCCLEI
ncbi:F-box/kelch-repeat protein At1g15670-like [Camellia sinensis]|uniref:F-box/kelch-repeat protein At1g15670-like n=1 Tax=Camellia sinensis TaxID=4442 RepID=UPI001036F29C|nr:F-box/kelch-repeat protein At1g15670-like [Camellia sinensis]